MLKIIIFISGVILSLFILYSIFFVEEENKKFTNNWFGDNSVSWNAYTNGLKDLPNKRCLEVGSFEGRSTLYLAKNYCNGENSYIDSVDTWNGSMEHSGAEKNDLYSRFTYNLKEYIESGKVRVHRGPSSDVLMKFILEVRSGKREKYDFIYIDASHIAKDVLMDSVLAWELLRVDGLMFFDDYRWEYPTSEWLKPKIAIDGFLNSYVTMYRILESKYQMRIRKIADSPAPEKQ
jgi:predicted O-methyltransferase YrrM